MLKLKGVKAKVEFIGAVATQIVELYEQENLLKKRINWGYIK